MIKNRIEAIIKALQPQVQVREFGFTMMELMAVIAVLSILTAIAVPAFSNMKDRSGMSNLHSTLMAHMKQGRVKGMAENRDVVIEFKPTKFNLAVAPVPLPVAGAAYVFDALKAASTRSVPSVEEERLVSVRDFSNKILITKNAPLTTAVKFSSAGGTANTTITLTSSNTNVAVKTITLNIVGRAYASTL
ncbi:MAG: prepilin-type N-terminal cleavage/methylation domain-containing protein [Mariprofundaceae bacterium]|nr:prepilin-type N-terminal cleavage/methylation domain-containing protein [Mariprofundaceae bacterium]